MEQGTRPDPGMGAQEVIRCIIPTETTVATVTTVTTAVRTVAAMAVATGVGVATEWQAMALRAGWRRISPTS